MTNEQLAAKALVEIFIDEMPPLKNQTGNSIMLHAKKSAIISQEEKIEALKKARGYSEHGSATFADIDNDIDFEYRVKKEIEEL
jgi:hypothetical protein